MIARSALLAAALLSALLSPSAFAAAVSGGSYSGARFGGPPLQAAEFVSLQDSTTFGPGGSIFDLAARVKPPTYIPPPSDDPADYAFEDDSLKLASCSSDETTWTAVKAAFTGASPSTFIWLPQGCRTKIFLTASKGDSAEYSIGNAKDDITVYCGDPAVCNPEIVYRTGSYPTTMETDGTTADGKFAFGEGPQKQVFEIGTGRDTSPEQVCDWDAAFRDAFVFGTHVVKLDSADCQITNTGSTAWGPGDVARVLTDRVTGNGQRIPTWLGRVTCVRTYGTAAAGDGTLYPNDPSGLCAGITEDNSVRFSDPLPWDFKPDAYYWGDAANVGDPFIKYVPGSGTPDPSGPTTYAETSGHVVEQVERAGTGRCNVVGPGICGNGTGTTNIAENIWFYGIAWEVTPQYVGGMFSAWKNAYGGGHYLGGPLNDSGRVAAVTFGKDAPQWEAGAVSLHTMDWWGTASNAKCFGEVLEITAGNPVTLKVAADSSTRCWNGSGTDTPNWGEPEIAFSDEVADSRLAGKRFLMTKGSFNDCVDLFNSGGPPQSSGSPDGICDDPATIGSWNITLTGLNGSNPDGSGTPIDTTPGGIASNIDRFAGATFYGNSYSSGLRVVNNFFVDPLQHAIMQGCTGCVLSANFATSDPALSVRGRGGPFRHGEGGACGQIIELNDQDFPNILLDSSNGESLRHGEGCQHTHYKLRFRDSGTLTWPMGTATGSDYAGTGSMFTIPTPTNQNGAANDKWSLVLASGHRASNTAAPWDDWDNYGGDGGVGSPEDPNPPNPPYLLHDLAVYRLRVATGQDLDAQLEPGSNNPTTLTDIFANENGESTTVPTAWGPSGTDEIGKEPSALYLTPAIKFWCEESGKIGEMGAYYDHITDHAANKKLPAEIRYRIAAGLGGTCTPVPPVGP